MMFARYPRGTEECCLTSEGKRNRAVMAVGGLPLRLVSAHPASPSYGLDHHCRAVKMSTTWQGLLSALLMLALHWHEASHL